MDEKLIGFVMASFGASDILSSLVLGRLSEKIGRKNILAISTAFGFVAFGLTWWISAKDRPWLFFIIMGLLGVNDAGYNTQLYSIIQTFQPTKLESAFAFFQGIRATSTGIAFFYTLFLDLHEITIIIIIVLCLGIISVFICDLLVAKVDGVKNISIQ